MRKQKIILIMLIATITLASIELIDLTSAQRITTFTGSGAQTTESFTIPTSKWQIDWTYTTSTPDYAMFTVVTFPKGETIRYTNMIAEDGAEKLWEYSETASRSGTEYIDSGKGDFYLKILDGNLDSYKIIIIQGQADPTPTVPEYSAYTVLIVIVAVVSLASIMLFKQRKN